MSLQVTIGFNPEALSAIAELTAAIRGISGGTPAATSKPVADKPASTSKSAKPEDDAAGTGPVTWANHAKGTFGEVDDEDAFKALKKKDSKIVKTTAKQHADLVAKAAAEEEEEEELPTEDDVLNAFGGYLPADLDKAERAKRAAFVKPLLARFGADKASKLDPEHRKLAINLVLRKAAGQDIDPETDDYEEFEAEEEGLV